MAPELQGAVHAHQHRLRRRAALAAVRLAVLAQNHRRPDLSFGVIVLERHVLVVQEREDAVPVLAQTFGQSLRVVVLIGLLGHLDQAAVQTPDAGGVGPRLEIGALPQADAVSQQTPQLLGKSLPDDNRTPGSVERKHQNISAVMINFGLPYISGYKPLGNYQALLAERVSLFLGGQHDFISVVGRSMDQDTESVAVPNLLGRLVEPPTKKDFNYSQVREHGPK